MLRLVTRLLNNPRLQDEKAWHFVALWMLVTTVALTVAISGAIGVYEAVPTAVGTVMGGAVLGAVFGLGQWWVLRKSLSQAGWWVLATTAGFAVIGAAAANNVDMDIPVAFYGSLAGFGVMTGVLFFWLLQHPIQSEGLEEGF